MLTGSARFFLIIALCSSIGMHWAALQSVAWATMLVDNARSGPIAEAIAKTFDGNHPCGLCKRVAAAKGSENKRDVQPLTAKPDLICATRAITLLPRCAGYSFAWSSVMSPERVCAPPVPPPRLEPA